MPSADAAPRAPARAVRLLCAAGDALARAPRALGALCAAGWGAFIWYLSGGPPPDVPATPLFSFIFNLAHAPLFGVLALLAALALPRAAPRGWPRLSRDARLGVVSLVLLYAVIDEWHQSRTPGRMPTWHDVLTDVAGATATLAVAAYLARADAGPRARPGRLALGLLACLAAAALASFG